MLQQLAPHQPLACPHNNVPCAMLQTPTAQQAFQQPGWVSHHRPGSVAGPDPCLHCLALLNSATRCAVSPGSCRPGPGTLCCALYTDPLPVLCVLVVTALPSLIWHALLCLVTSRLASPPVCAGGHSPAARGLVRSVLPCKENWAFQQGLICPGSHNWSGSCSALHPHSVSCPRRKVQALEQDMAQLEAQVQRAQAAARQSATDAAVACEACTRMQLWAEQLTQQSLRLGRQDSSPPAGTVQTRLQRLEGLLAGLQREQARHRGAGDDGADSIPSTRDHPADTNEDPT